MHYKFNCSWLYCNCNCFCLNSKPSFRTFARAINADFLAAAFNRPLDEVVEEDFFVLLQRQKRFRSSGSWQVFARWCHIALGRDLLTSRAGHTQYFLRFCNRWIHWWVIGPVSFTRVPVSHQHVSGSVIVMIIHSFLRSRLNFLIFSVDFRLKLF